MVSQGFLFYLAWLHMPSLVYADHFSWVFLFPSPRVAVQLIFIVVTSLKTGLRAWCTEFQVGKGVACLLQQYSEQCKKGYEATHFHFISIPERILLYFSLMLEYGCSGCPTGCSISSMLLPLMLRCRHGILSDGPSKLSWNNSDISEVSATVLSRFFPAEKFNQFMVWSLILMCVNTKETHLRSV